MAKAGALNLCARLRSVKPARYTWVSTPLHPLFQAPLQPVYPVEFAATLKVPVLGWYGAKDAGIPVAPVEQMCEALKAAGNTVRHIVLYDGFKRMLAWFK